MLTLLELLVSLSECGVVMEDAETLPHRVPRTHRPKIQHIARTHACIYQSDQSSQGQACVEREQGWSACLILWLWISSSKSSRHRSASAWAAMYCASEGRGLPFRLVPGPWDLRASPTLTGSSISDEEESP